MINVRTDLAIENTESIQTKLKEELEGVRIKKYEYDQITVTDIEIINEIGSFKMDKPVGNYITIEIPEIEELEGATKESCIKVLKQEIEKIIHIQQNTKVLIVGLGNHNITPDALGPKTASKILVTRHRFLYLEAKDNIDLTNVSVITPGVMGNTGIESVDLIKGVVEEIKPDVIIAVDALAARNVKRVTTTIQMSDTGVSPGSGVGNYRRGINEQTLGTKVIAIGVPTVITAASIVSDYLTEVEQVQKQQYDCAQKIIEDLPGDMIVTPGNIDAVIDKFSGLLSDGINRAIHPKLSQEDINNYLN